MRSTCTPPFCKEDFQGTSSSMAAKTEGRHMTMKPFCQVLRAKIPPALESQLYLFSSSQTYEREERERPVTTSHGFNEKRRGEKSYGVVVFFVIFTVHHRYCPWLPSCDLGAEEVVFLFFPCVYGVCSACAFV